MSEPAAPVERARYVKPGEALAMASNRLHQDRRGFFWMFGGSIKPNERKGDVTIVHVRGELEHHKGWCESYEGILERMGAAYSGQDVADAHEREHRYDADFQPMIATPPKAIILCVDSPGGVVSGLFECVKELQRMRAEHPDIRVLCYVDEMATSAAYALACSCDEIACPPSAIIGSIGVISTMISQSARDKKEGFDVRLLTSGARKADGHLHAPISDAAVEVETDRVEKLAVAFFKVAGKARGISVEKLRSLQAGIFLGKDAIREELADTLTTFGDLVAEAQGKTNVPATAGGNRKRMNLPSLIKKTKAALAATDDPAEIRELSATLGTYSAALEAYKKTEKHVEHTKTEEGADDSDDEEDDEASSAKKDDASSAKADDEASTAASEDDEEDDDDEAKSAKKALALVKSITGMASPKKAFGALQAIAMTAANVAKDVAQLKRDQAASEKASLIAGAKGKYLTTPEAAWLASQPMATVKGFVEMRRKAGVIVHTDETTLVRSKEEAPGTEASLPEFTRNMIDAAVATMPLAQREKGRAELVAAHLEAHNDQIAAAMNGAGGRY